MSATNYLAFLTCPSCEAESGEPCVTPSGKRKVTVHDLRPFVAQSFEYQQKKLVEAWNAEHPIGTRVTAFHTTARNRIRAETTTKTKAFIADSGTAVIFLEGVRGYWMLECVVARP